MLSQVIEEAPELAQVEKVGGHTCKTTPNRNKANVDDFWSILNGSSTTKYSDDDFQNDDGSVAWSEFNETLKTGVTW